MVLEEVSVQGSEEINKELAKLKNKDLKPYWNSAKSIIWKNTAKRFREGGGSQGRWAPLTLATITLRKYNKSSGQILQDQGLLLKSVTTQESIKSETKSKLIIGTNLKYAEAMQKGFKVRVTSSMRRYFLAMGLYPGPVVGGDIEVPARRFLYVDSKDRGELEKALQYFYVQQLRRSG